MAREAAIRRREMLDKISTTIDSTLTLIETISNKLELVRFDYRGLDDLKAELNLMHNLLGRAKFLRRSQSSVLFSFFERLWHFYFLIRSEERFVYEMVAEIAKFCEVVEGFRREFCEWNTSLLDAVLDKLPAAGVKSGDRRKLEVELKLIKLFYQCAINERYKEGNEFFKSDVKFGVDDNAKQLYCCFVKLEASGKGLNLELSDTLSSCQKSFIASCKDVNVWVRDLYSSMLDPMLISRTYPWFSSELIAFIDYLLECLGDIRDACGPEVWEFIYPLKRNLMSWKQYLDFTSLLVEKPWMFKSCVIHCQVSAVKVMCLGYMFWFCRDNDQVVCELHYEFSELVTFCGARNAYIDYMMELVIKNLSDSLKQCLLYMTAFPEGREIVVKRLVWLLISEGIVWQKELMDLEDEGMTEDDIMALMNGGVVKGVEGMAEKIILVLIQRNFVLVAEKSSMGKVKTCRINGCVRDFCLSVSKEESFLQLIGMEHEFSDLDMLQYLNRLVIYSQPRDLVNLRCFPSRLNSLIFYSKSPMSRSITYSLSSHFHPKHI